MQNDILSFHCHGRDDLRDLKKIGLEQKQPLRFSSGMLRKEQRDTKHKIWEKIPFKDAQYNYFHLYETENTVSCLKTKHSQSRPRYVYYLQPTSQTQKKNKSWKHAVFNPVKATLLPLCFNVQYANLLTSTFCMKVNKKEKIQNPKPLAHTTCLKDQRFSYLLIPMCQAYLKSMIRESSWFQLISYIQKYSIACP